MDENNSLFPEESTDLQGVSINAVDVMQQKFQVRFRGYDVQDVDSFLELVAKEIEKLAGDNARARDDIAAMRQEIGRYKKKEESINAALVTVQKLADDMRNRAVADAENTLEDARQQAGKIVAEAEEKKAAAEQEGLLLKQRAERDSSGIIDAARTQAEKISEEAQQHKDAAREEAALIRQKAEDEAAGRVGEARSEAERIREDSRREHAAAGEELNSLRQKRIQFQASLKSLIETHLRLLESDND